MRGCNVEKFKLYLYRKELDVIHNSYFALHCSLRFNYITINATKPFTEFHKYKHNVLIELRLNVLIKQNKLILIEDK